MVKMMFLIVKRQWRQQEGVMHTFFAMCGHKEGYLKDQVHLQTNLIVLCCAVLCCAFMQTFLAMCGHKEDYFKEMVHPQTKLIVLGWAGLCCAVLS